MAVVNSASLPGKQGVLVNQAGDPVHLNYMLDILLLPQSIQRYLELIVTLHPCIETLRIPIAALEAAAKLD